MVLAFVYIYGAEEGVSWQWLIAAVVGKFWSSSLFFFLPHPLVISRFVCRKCKGIKDVKKKKNKDTYTLNLFFFFFFFFYEYSVLLMFSWTRSSRCVSVKVLKYTMESYSAVTSLRIRLVPLQPTGDAARCWAPELSQQVHSLLAAERKMSVWSRRLEVTWRVSLWRLEAPLFSHSPVLLPVRGLLGNCYFSMSFISFFISLYFLFRFNSHV